MMKMKRRSRGRSRTNRQTGSRMDSAKMRKKMRKTKMRKMMKMMRKMMVMKEKNRIHRTKTQIAVLMDLVKNLTNWSLSLSLKNLMNWRSLKHSGN